MEDFWDNLYDHIALGIFYALVIAAIIAYVWMTSSPSGQSGQCREELGYMGQTEAVECYADEGRRPVPEVYP